MYVEICEGGKVWVPALKKQSMSTSTQEAKPKYPLPPDPALQQDVILDGEFYNKK